MINDTRRRLISSIALNDAICHENELSNTDT